MSVEGKVAVEKLREIAALDPRNWARHRKAAQQFATEAASALVERDAEIARLTLERDEARIQTDRWHQVGKLAVDGVTAELETALATLATRDAEIVKAVAAERRACAALVEDEMPATQDMTSTFICDALERASTAIRARDGQVEERG